MAKYALGYNGQWRERFDDREEAIEWARQVAETGWTVEVITRRIGFARFLTAFPESERGALEATWSRPGLLTGFFGDDSPGNAYSHYGSAFGGHGGGRHGGH